MLNTSGAKGMSAPKGNKYAKGNKGGGRKTHAEERAKAELIRKLFEEEVDVEKLRRKIRAGRASPLDVMLLKILEGNTRLLSKLFNLVYPTKRIHRQILKQRAMDQRTGQKS